MYLSLNLSYLSIPLICNTRYLNFLPTHCCSTDLVFLKWKQNFLLKLLFEVALHQTVYSMCILPIQLIHWLIFLHIKDIVISLWLRLAITTSLCFLIFLNQIIVYISLWTAIWLNHEWHFSKNPTVWFCNQWLLTTSKCTNRYIWVLLVSGSWIAFQWKDYLTWNERRKDIILCYCYTSTILCDNKMIFSLFWQVRKKNLFK